MQKRKGFNQSGSEQAREKKLIGELIRTIGWMEKKKEKKIDFNSREENGPSLSNSRS